MTNRVIYLTTANSLGPKLEPDLNGGTNVRDSQQRNTEAMTGEWQQ